MSSTDFIDLSTSNTMYIDINKYIIYKHTYNSMLSFGVYTGIYDTKGRTTLVISGSAFEPEKSWRTVPA